MTITQDFTCRFFKLQRFKTGCTGPICANNQKKEPKNLLTSQAELTNKRAERMLIKRHRCMMMSLQGDSRAVCF